MSVVLVAVRAHQYTRAVKWYWLTTGKC